jgi:3-oxoacyl-[acyl-carrier protein] reductase
MALEGKVVLVTGAAKGIGRYIAHGFAKEGARLAIADMTSMDNVMRELKEMDAEVFATAADVRDEAQVQQLIDSVVQHYGRIDVLVNNAGIVPHFAWGVPRWAPVREIEKTFWDNVLQTNLGGTVLCTKHALRHMHAQGSGHVINLHGGGGGVGAAAYVVSKDAIKSFTKYVAQEEQEAGVCIVCLSPGGTIAHEEAPEEARARIPGPELAENRFQLAAEAPMEMSGHLLDLKDGKLVVAD